MPVPERESQIGKSGGLVRSLQLQGVRNGNVSGELCSVENAPQKHRQNGTAGGNCVPYIQANNSLNKMLIYSK